MPTSPAAFPIVWCSVTHFFYHLVACPQVSEFPLSVMFGVCVGMLMACVVCQAHFNGVTVEENAGLPCSHLSVSMTHVSDAVQREDMTVGRGTAVRVAVHHGERSGAKE